MANKKLKKPKIYFDPSMITPHKNGVYTLDTMFMRRGLVASHLLVENGQAVFIDVGVARSLPILLAALDHLGLTRDQVVAVIVTHVHLDHAGCAGALLKKLPNARLLVHPSGARHMIDPSKLTAGATAVYGKELMRRRFGKLEPIPAERVIEADEIFKFRFGRSHKPRELSFMYTPGHARHHMCVHDSLTNGIYTGDSFGLSYRDFDTEKGPFIVPTTTPVQFDPGACHASIDKLMRKKPSYFYLTHFGVVSASTQLAESLHKQIDLFVGQALAVHRLKNFDHLEALKQQLEKLLLAQLAEHGCQLDEQEIRRLMAMDIDLNAQGLIDWLQKNQPE